MLLYALKSALVLTLLYGGFSALLSQETFHRFNRMMLLGIVLLSLVLPAVHITTNIPTPFAQTTYPLPLLVRDGSKYLQDENGETETATPLSHAKGNGGEAIGGEAVGGESLLGDGIVESVGLSSLYILGLFIALCAFAFRAFILIRLLHGGFHTKDTNGNTIIIKGGKFPPFSFMHWIAISIGDYEQHRRCILTHEQAHARLGHTWDLLLLEVVQVVQWFNPFAWLLGRKLKAIHEYEADEAVICQGIDAKQYQQLLVIKAVGNRLQLLANTLNRGSLKKRINMMQQKKSNRWRMLRAMFAIPVTILAVMAFAEKNGSSGEYAIRQQGERDFESPTRDSRIVNPAGQSNDEGMLLVEYKTHEKWGKSYRDYYCVHLPQGVWVENNGTSHIEEQCFTYSFDNTQNGKLNKKVIMMLNGTPFDQDHLPNLKSRDLKKIEIKLGERATVDVNMPTKALNIQGKQTTVNLITTPVTIPAGIEGNVPRVQTLLLPGKGELYIKNGKATPGDWMHCSITDWEPTSYGYSVRDEFERSKTKPGFKCWIYASKETAERDISRAEALMRELGITNYEVVRNLPKKHFTDTELRKWAQTEKAKGTPFSRLFDAMAPNHMDCADVHRQWHIVKAVYGRK